MVPTMKPHNFKKYCYNDFLRTRYWGYARQYLLYGNTVRISEDEREAF